MFVLYNGINTKPNNWKDIIKWVWVGYKTPWLVLMSIDCTIK